MLRRTDDPRTSTTSALPQRLETLRLPCLATRAPAAAAMTVAPVEMLTDPMPSPPVPTMSSTARGKHRGYFGTMGWSEGEFEGQRGGHQPHQKQHPVDPWAPSLCNRTLSGPFLLESTFAVSVEARVP